MSWRVVLDQVTTRRLIYALFAVQACVVGGISYQHRHGNPLRMGVDEHGVLRFQSMREYLTDEVKVSLHRETAHANAPTVSTPHAQYEELRLREDPGDETRFYDLEVRLNFRRRRSATARHCAPLPQLKKARLAAEMDRIDALGFVGEREVPLREEELW